MKFIIPANLLLKELQAIKGLLNTNNAFFFPILNYYLFEIEKNQLTIYGSDLDKTITKVMKVESQDSGKIVMPARLLIDTLESFKNTPITFKIDEKKFKIIMVTEYGKYKMDGKNVAKFPKFENKKSPVKKNKN